MKTQIALTLQTLLIVLGLGTVGCRAQTISTKPQLRPGDAFRLEATRVRRDSTQPQQDGRSRTTVELRVLTATPDGFVIEWSPGLTSSGVSDGDSSREHRPTRERFQERYS